MKFETSQTDESSICLYLNNGKLKVRAHDWRNVRRNLGDKRDLGWVETNYTHTSSTTFYDLGWNMISLTVRSSSFTYRSAKNFGSILSETITYSLQYNVESDSILGAWRKGTDLSDSPSGIIHTVWIREADMSNSDLNSYIAPRTGCTNICDYYVAMYKDMTVSNTTTYYNAIDMLGTNINIEFKINS